jgi:tRNA threonylcarbamoyladenosine biosynthesis protein TsaB
MKLLAIDTALEACSVAVVADGLRAPLAITEIVGRGHAERLFGMIEAAMNEAGIGFADLDRIAVIIGPGSFTGLRVGIAAARGLALVVKCPVVGIGSLAVHAESARALAGAVPVVAVLDARRDEVYGQRFTADGAPDAGPEVGPAEHFAGMARPGDVLAGSGADIVAGAMPSGQPALIVHRLSAPDINALVRLALYAPETGKRPRPLYLRPPDAKPQATKGVARQ